MVAQALRSPQCQPVKPCQPLTGHNPAPQAHNMWGEPRCKLTPAVITTPSWMQHDWLSRCPPSVMRGITSAAKLSNW